MRSLVYIFFLGILITSCKSTNTKNSPVKNEEGNNPFETIVKAQVVDIPSNLEKYSAESICNKYPCDAYVVIQSISKKGQSYHGQFNNQDTLLIHFNFTLSETNSSMFPYITKHLPGIIKGQIIEAAILTTGEPAQPTYQINEYKILV